MALAGVAALYRFHIRPWMYTWGARADEVTATLPGDALVDDASVRTTRAVTVDAPVHDVWPWLAQIGEGRGGFYSYSLFERAVGADIHNADVIHPEWQQVQVGDTIWLARRYRSVGRQIVAAVEAGAHLVLVSPDDFERIREGGRAGGCWSFVLRPDGARTRLLIRGSGKPVGHVWFDIPHFVMEQKMMRGVARRATRQAGRDSHRA